MAKIETIRDRLHEENSDAILLGAPSFVPLDKTNKFPMASLRVTESLKAYEAPFQDFAILTVMDLETNRLKANFFVEQKFLKIERDPDSPPPPEGKVSDGGALDLVSRGILPSSIGDYYSTVLILGSKSNRVRTFLAEEALEHNPGKLNRALEYNARNAKASAQSRRTIVPIKIGPEPGSPPVPDSIAISMKVSQLKISEEVKPKLVLFLSFSLPVRPTKATQTFHLLATGSLTPSPLVWQIEIPLKSESSSGPFFQGHFSVDADGLIGMNGGQTWYFYVFSGKEMSDAVSVDLNPIRD